MEGSNKKDFTGFYGGPGLQLQVFDWVDGFFLRLKRLPNDFFDDFMMKEGEGNPNKTRPEVERRCFF